MKNKQTSVEAAKEQDLIRRIWQVKSAFIEAGIASYVPILKAHYSEYRENKSAAQTAHQVWNCQLLDELTVRRFENIVEIIKNS